MVDKHTAERAAYSAGAVTWNQSLADAAQAWADGCKYGHATNGENIAAGTDGYSSADLFDLWASERVYYDWANPGPNSLDPQQDVGHWTQIVWKASTQIGCGLATCATLKDSGFGDGVSAAYLVCRYYEQGNLQIYGTGVNNYEVNIGPAV
jgi:uncharacterized protein YkwD